jgi:hypothetical protein
VVGHVESQVLAHHCQANKPDIGAGFFRHIRLLSIHL